MAFLISYSIMQAQSQLFVAIVCYSTFLGMTNSRQAYINSNGGLVTCSWTGFRRSLRSSERHPLTRHSWYPLAYTSNNWRIEKRRNVAILTSCPLIVIFTIFRGPVRGRWGQCGSKSSTGRSILFTGPKVFRRGKLNGEATPLHYGTPGYFHLQPPVTDTPLTDKWIIFAHPFVTQLLKNGPHYQLRLTSTEGISCQTAIDPVRRYRYATVKC